MPVGSVLTDYSGHTRNGSYNGDVMPVNTTGPWTGTRANDFGTGGLNVVANAEVSTVTYPQLLVTAPWSCDFWYWLDAKGNYYQWPAGNRTTLGFGPETYGWNFYVMDTSDPHENPANYGHFNFWTGKGPSANSFWDQLPGPIPNTGQWYYIALTHDGTTKSLYVDGSLYASNTSTYYPITSSMGGGVNGEGNGLGIAADAPVGATGGGSWAQITGKIARVGLYGTALSAGRIAARYGYADVATYDNAVLADAPLGYWHVDEVAVLTRLGMGRIEY